MGCEDPEERTRQHTTMTAPLSEERIQTVVFMRHAAARHNFHGAELDSPSLFDPPLVAQGKIAALQAGEGIRTWWHTTQVGEPIELIITSPLTRCIQTTVIAFLPGDDYERHTPIHCAEEVREAFGMHYPDKRRDKSVLMVSLSVFENS
jgi:phosphohistidine phosphatase SixA